MSQQAAEPQTRRNQARQSLQKGVSAHLAGRINEAEALYQQALRLAPNDPSALHLLGVVALNRGDLKRAEELIRRALQGRPDFADGHLNLGNVLLAAARPREAADRYRRAIALTPGMAMAHSNLARALIELDEYETAIESARAAIQLNPTMAGGHINLGAALAKAKRFAEAETALLRAAMLQPGRSETHRDLGAVLIELARPGEALVCHDRAVALSPSDTASHLGRAKALAATNDFAAAEPSFRRAVELDPTSPDAWLGLGWSLRLMGRFEDSEACLERVRVLDPGRADAYRHLAAPGPATGDAQQIARLTAQLDDSGKPPRDRALAGFALGRILDGIERYDDAFERYRAANALIRAANEDDGVQYDPASFRRHVDLLIERHAPGSFETMVGEPSDLPVFVVGLPRSGTTLTEQIAASHSQVFGAGELHAIGNIADALAGAGQGNRQVAARQADADLAARLAHSHLLHLRHLGGDARRVIDKMPDNVLHLGLIARLFPGARVVFCTRDDRDIGLSCYFQLFSTGLQPFSYDLGDCGRRAAEVARLVAHWRQALPLRWHEVNYEALINDLESESRRLIAFLGLSWEPSCLEFHRTERTVTTMSHWQVRQPIYDRAVGRWRKYERHLAPLFEGLALGSSVSG